MYCFLSKLRDRLNDEYILTQVVNGVWPEKLSELGGLSESSVLELTDLDCISRKCTNSFIISTFDDDLHSSTWLGSTIPTPT